MKIWTKTDTTETADEGEHIVGLGQPVIFLLVSLAKKVTNLFISLWFQSHSLSGTSVTIELCTVHMLTTAFLFSLPLALAFEFDFEFRL